MSSRPVCGHAHVVGENSSRSPSPPRSGLALATCVVGMDAAISRREKRSSADFPFDVIMNKRMNRVQKCCDVFEAAQNPLVLVCSSVSR
jgi:hypothetical protein